METDDIVERDKVDDDDDGDPEKLVDDPVIRSVSMDGDNPKADVLIDSDYDMSDIGEGVDAEDVKKDEPIPESDPVTEPSKKKIQFGITSLCNCFTKAAKVYTFHNEDDSQISMFHERPPLPSNMPRAGDFLKRIEYRQQRVTYGKDKIEYYIQVCTLSHPLLCNLLLMVYFLISYFLFFPYRTPHGISNPKMAPSIRMMS